MVAVGNPLGLAGSVAADRRHPYCKRMGARAYLGLAGSPVPLPPALAHQREQGTGLRIAEVVPNGPAEKAGLLEGDLLLSAGDSFVTNAQSLQKLMLADAIGRPLSVTAFRNEALVDTVIVPIELGLSD